MTAQATSLHSAFLTADGHTSSPLHAVTAVTDRVQRHPRAAVMKCLPRREATAVTDRVQRHHRAAVTKCLPRHEVAALMDHIQHDHRAAVTRYLPHRRVTPMPVTQVHRRLASHSAQQPGPAQPSISTVSPEAVPE
jgi:hypothetical protein